MRRPQEPSRLRVDPVSCAGIGLCAQITGAVELDRWGYPVLEPVVPDGDLRSARRAVRACPRRALWLEPADAGGSSTARP